VNDLTARITQACGLVLLCMGLVGCAEMPWPLNSRPVVMRAPMPPQVVSANSTTRNLPPCPQQLIAQAQWLARNMARIRLGYNKLQVVSVLGDPANSETFSLSNGAAVEVLFYHTPETICRQSARSEGLMPLVFQDDRLLGYGQNYYQQFIVPSMRPMAVPAAPAADLSGAQGMPQARVQLTPGPALVPAPARTGRLLQEDLPQAQATPPAGIYAPTPVTSDGNGYSGAMTRDMRPVNYYESPAQGAVGRGDPIR
jgi:Protein of unknown function (DUF3192)